MKLNYIFFICICFINSLHSIGQSVLENKTVCCIPDSLVIKPPGSAYIHSAIPLKKSVEIYNSISKKIRRYIYTKYFKIKGKTLYYYVDINKSGNSIEAKCYSNYKYQNIFDSLIVDYLLKLKFQPAFVLKSNRKTFINDTKYYEIKIN